MSGQVKTLEDYLDLFDGWIKTSKGYLVSCCSHEDSTPSLHITTGRDGKLLVKCFAGCDSREILGYINGKSVPVKTASAKASGKRFRKEISLGTLSAIYTYTDEFSRPMYQVLRYRDPKTFRFRRLSSTPDEVAAFGEYIWHIDENSKRFLYNWPSVKAAIGNRLIWKVEGEKDADRLSAAGLVATCNLFGSGPGKWIASYNSDLRGADVAVVPDEDSAGYVHAYGVCAGLLSDAKTVKVLFLPVGLKGDVSDFLDSGKSIEDLKNLYKESVINVTGFSDSDLRQVFGIVESASGTLAASKFKKTDVSDLRQELLDSLLADVAPNAEDTSEFARSELFRQATELLEAEGAYAGICNQCFNTGFIFKNSSGAYGVVAEEFAVQDSHGEDDGHRATIQLKKCSHGLKAEQHLYDF